MKIIAVSDLHGNLVKISDNCDVFVIAGDWSPLYTQHDYSAMMKWVNDKFIPWMKRLNANHIIFIAGNHDLVCTYSHFINDLNIILNRNKMENRVHYLNRSSVFIKGKKFYGIPDTEGMPAHWAFTKFENVNYDFDSDTQVLITHQPPKIGSIGCVCSKSIDLGSNDLKDKILNSSIELNICGHIHTGSHQEHIIKLVNGNLARIYNASILNEEYNVSFLPQIIELP